MKHIFSILFVAILVAAAWWITQSEPLPQDRIVIFTQKTCSHCHEALAFIDTKIKPNYPQIAVEARDISEKQYLNQLRTLARQEKWDSIGTPVIVVGNTKIVGWSALKEMQLMSAIKKIAPTPQGTASKTANTIPNEASVKTEEGLCTPGMEEPCL